MKPFCFGEKGEKRIVGPPPIVDICTLSPYVCTLRTYVYNTYIRIADAEEK